MLKTGDKIKYVKANSFIGLPLGTMFTVTDIQGTVVALETKIEFGSIEGIAKCVMSYDEYEKYFEKIIEPEIIEEKKPTWTEWRKIENDELYKIIHGLKEHYYIAKYLKHYIQTSEITVETRNNGKKTDVRIKLDEYVKSTSTCNKAFDKFDEATGIQVALMKLFPKILTLYSTKYIRNNY